MLAGSCSLHAQSWLCRLQCPVTHTLCHLMAAPLFHRVTVLAVLHPALFIQYVLAVLHHVESQFSNITHEALQREQHATSVNSAHSRAPQHVLQHSVAPRPVNFKPRR